MEDKPILLTVLTPDGVQDSVRCDSVRLTVPDSRNGRVPGGSVGIRRGHAPALMTLAPGKVEAFRGGAPIFSRPVEGGLAFVDKDTVSVLADRLI